MISSELATMINDSDISQYVYGKLLRCISPFLSWLKKGQSYWLEYKGDNTYEVRSDNNLGKNFKMEIHQLLTCFVPVNCETDITAAIRHFHWLGKLGIHRGYVDDYINYLIKEEQQ